MKPRQQLTFGPHQRNNKEDFMNINRGDIFYVNLSETVGSEERSGRPAIIVSNRLCNKHSPVVVFQTWIFLLCYFSCGRQTCFDCSTGGLSFPSHRLSLFYSTGIARGCLFSAVKTTRKTGGLHKPYKGLRQAAPKGAVKRSADRI